MLGTPFSNGMGLGVVQGGRKGGTLIVGCSWGKQRGKKTGGGAKFIGEITEDKAINFGRSPWMGKKKKRNLRR